MERILGVYGAGVYIGAMILFTGNPVLWFFIVLVGAFVVWFLEQSDVS
jgi:hypothetical protein